MFGFVQACWRNVYLNGQFLDPFSMNPFLYDLPRAGILTLDFVSYNLPTFKHADLLSKLICPRASTFRSKPPARVVPATGLPKSKHAASPEHVSASGTQVAESFNTTVKKIKGVPLALSSLCSFFTS
jgi:hypothetical protein